jgi:hypothetical protein
MYLCLVHDEGGLASACVPTGRASVSRRVLKREGGHDRMTWLRGRTRSHAESRDADLLLCPLELVQ